MVEYLQELNNLLEPMGITASGTCPWDFRWDTGSLTCGDVAVASVAVRKLSETYTGVPGSKSKAQFFGASSYWLHSYAKAMERVGSPK